MHLAGDYAPQTRIVAAAVSAAVRSVDLTAFAWSLTDKEIPIEENEGE